MKPMKETRQLLLNGRKAADACGVSYKTWRMWHLVGYIPEPVMIGKSLFWRVDELVRWTEAKCPSRDEWTYRPEKDISKIFQKLCPFAGRPG